MIGLERHFSTSEIVAAYDAMLARQGRAPSTRVKCTHGVRVFLDWAEGTVRSQISSVDIDRFLGTWERDWESRTGAAPSRATVRARIAALRSFFDYLGRAGLLRDPTGQPIPNPMAAIIAPVLEQRRNDFLRPLEDAALLACEYPPSERICRLASALDRITRLGSMRTPTRRYRPHHRP